MINVALDAEGGDHGLEATVAGAAAVSLEASDIHVMLVGAPERVEAALARVRHDRSRLTVVQSDGVAGMGEDPRAALERQPRCSIAVAADLVHQGAAQALVSAGNTGATILAAAQRFERLPGVRRAALAAVYPTEQRHGPRGDPFALMLDVGATLHVGPEELVSFAVMGSAYSSIISEIAAPRVALLSNGTEPSKGTPEIVEAHARLVASGLPFAGNVEGLDIPRGTVDVVVCEGFLGNVVLKMLEGVSDVARSVARSAASKSLQWKLALALLGSGLAELQKLTDWKSYGGAPLLGLDRVVIKAHGRSESRAIRNAVKVAAKAHRGDLIEKIRSGVRGV
jgi:phosphate acyltransferase